MDWVKSTAVFPLVPKRSIVIYHNWIHYSWNIIIKSAPPKIAKTQRNLKFESFSFSH